MAQFRFKTASWFARLPDDHIKIGTSRGVPRRMEAGYRVYRKLAPGPWFNSVDTLTYDQLYQDEVLKPLDPVAVANEIVALAGGKVPCLVCYEKIGDPKWCHRALIAEWLYNALGEPVPELTCEHLPQSEHPLMAPELRHRMVVRAPVDLNPFLGRQATIDGELHTVVAIDLEKPGTAIIQAGDRTFPAGLETLQQYFGQGSKPVQRRRGA